MQTTSHAPSRHSTAGAAGTAAAIVLALSACGGGGGVSSTGDGGSGPAAATPPASLSITGTAADGAAIAAGSVDAKCAATGSATVNASAATAPDGSFALSLTGGALPCVLRVTSGALVLHGLATGSGASARANLTPVSELVVAQLTGGTAATYFGAWDGSAASALTSGSVQAAATAVLDTLKSAGVDFTAAGDVMAGALVAANGSTAGNAHDKALEQLKAQLASSGTTLATLAQTVAASSPAAPAALLSSAASLPANMLLKPAAANCASLRSGSYRVVVNEAASSPSTGVVVIDAVTLKVNDGNETTVLRPTGTCAYTNDSGGELAVTKAGVIVTRVGSDAAGSKASQGAVAFPEQSHTAAEFAGEWNAIAFDRTTDTGPVHLTSYTATFDSSGKLSAINFCDDLRACTASTAATLPNVTHTVNTGGGFNEVNATDNYIDRAFLYRAGGGELMLVTLASAGHISFATRKVSATLPAVGRVQDSWTMTLTAQYTAPAAISTSKNTVVSVDSSAGSFVRNAIQNFSTGATRPETLQINSLRDGYFRRLPATGVAHSDGSSSNVAEFIGLTMRGMDLSVIALPAGNQLLLSPTALVVNP